MAPKRTARGRPGKSPPMKKARAGSLQEKINMVVDAFEDKEQVGQLQLPGYCQNMFTSAIPAALGKGAAADERHNYQARVAVMIGSVLDETAKFWEDKVGESAGTVSSIESEKAKMEGAVTSAEEFLKEKCSAVDAAETALEEAKSVVSDAEGNVASVQDDLDMMEGQQVQKLGQKDKWEAALRDNFDVLRANEFETEAEYTKAEAKLLKPLNTLLKQIKVEGSLISAMPAALAKKPDARGPFDNMVVEQVEAQLRNKLSGIEAYLRDFEGIKAKNEAAVSEAKSALEPVEAHKARCDDALSAARGHQSEAEVALKNAQDNLKEETKKLDEAESEKNERETTFKTAQANMGAFTFLYERVQTVPEPPTEEPAAM